MRLRYSSALLTLVLQSVLLWGLVTTTGAVASFNTATPWLFAMALLAIAPVALIALGKEAQQQLAAAEKRILDFAEASSDYFWETDAEHRFSWFSPRLEAVTGMDPDKLLGRKRLEIVEAQRDPDKWERHQQALNAHQRFRNFDFETRTASGEHRTFRIGGNPIFAADGRFAGYRGSGLNITEAVRAQRSEARLLRAIDNLPDCVGLYDEADRLLTCNNAYREMFLGDASLHPHIGRTFEEILEANHANQQVSDEVRRELVNERLQRHRRADGAPLLFLMPDGLHQVARDFRMHDGGTMVLVADHTELAEREARLAFTEQRLRDFLETAADWFWETDADGQFTSVSERYFEVMGFERHAVIGQRRDELPGNSGPDPQRQKLNDLMAAQQVIRGVTYTRTNARGELRYLRISGKPRFDASGTFIGYRGTGNDVTATALAHAEARRAETRFKESLEYSADGIALYDADDKLVVWNKVYLERYLPDVEELEAGMSFETVLGLGIGTGTISNAGPETELYRLRMQQHNDALGEANRYQRNDGRWSEVREFRTSERGVLLVISDVTSQMRIFELTRTLAVRASGRRDELLSSILGALCSATQMRVGLVALREDDGTLRTDCVIVDGEQAADFTFRASDSVCAESLAGNAHFIHRGLHIEYPQDLLVTRFDAQSVFALPIRNTAGEPLGLLVLANDEAVGNNDLLDTLPPLVAERLGAEITHEATQQALAASERELRAVLDNSPVQIALKDLRGRYLRVNQFWRSFNGIDMEVSGKTASEVFVDAPWLQAAHESDRAVLQENRTITEEIERPSPDGTRTVLMQRFPLRDEHGTPIGLGLVGTDMTSVRAAETKARAALELLRNAINSMTDGFTLFDPHDRLVMCNEKLLEMWPFAADALKPGARRMDLRQEIIAYGAVARVNGSETAARDPQWGENPELELTDGRWYEVHDYKADDEATIVVTIDVTARKHMERSQQAYRAQLEQQVAQRTRDLEQTREALLHQERLATMGRFSATVSHELRNPLGSARNACHILKKIAGDDTQVMKYVNLVDREIAHSVHIMNNLLETTRLRAPTPQRVDMRQLLEASMETLDMPDGIVVEIDIPAGFEVVGDPDQLRQVLTNLMRNAIEASPDKAVVQVSARHDGAFSDVEIRDQGPGIKPGERSKIFEPLYSSKATGSGLGLWISREVMRCHDGELSLRNTADGAGASGGACFVLRLPKLAA